MLFRQWAQVAAMDDAYLGATTAVSESAVASGSGGYYKSSLPYRL
jgi:hypothetical protein